MMPAAQSDIGSTNEEQAPVEANHKRPELHVLKGGADQSLQDSIKAACRRIAPSWPLNRMIAVNPLWGFTEQNIQSAATSVQTLSGAHFTMSMDWYLQQFDKGLIPENALQVTLQRHGLDMSSARFKSICEQEQAPQKQFTLITDMLDQTRDLSHQPSCRDVVVHAIGQHCASWFDQGQARWKPTHATSLYAAWREIALHDNGPSLLLGMPDIATRIAALPEQHDALIRAACDHLQLKQDECETYFTALLLSVNGWSAWCAYLNWQAEQEDGSDDHLQQLLAIRLAWEWVLADSRVDREALIDDWQKSRAASPQQAVQSHAWVWQTAMEIQWQQQVHQGLLQSKKMQASAKTRPSMQAVFCIDVRSERMRRALEASDSGIRTHGFAGFFGLPIDYLPFAGKQARPQLPGLLAPKMRVVSQAKQPSVTQALIAKRRFRLGLAQAWDRFRTSASSGFGFVETTGLSYAWKLLQASLYNAKPSSDGTYGLNKNEQDSLQPQIDGIAIQDAIDTAAAVLGAMSMTDGYAPIVLLIGHGSQTANNPHAAGLDCGACCGQTGEINARVLAGLLNQEVIRTGLQEKGITIPSDTRFIAGLHNTTTDEIRLFDVLAYGADKLQIAQAQRWLDQASALVRVERAPSLGLNTKSNDAISNSIAQRASDWSQTRPEWGLANNAAFIAAPRERTRHSNLQGRSFLHDYDHAKDTGYKVLELILTAPVVVAHWINMQYYASTVDNLHWGSGNKVLHNVVGANIGVFEGNGGDLRIGLSMQSLHDGEDWVHTPLRLSVWIEAPRAAIANIVQGHAKLSQLVHGEWLHLFCIEPDSGEVFRYAVNQTEQGQWIAESNAA